MRKSKYFVFTGRYGTVPFSQVRNRFPDVHPGMNVIFRANILFIYNFNQNIAHFYGIKIAGTIDGEQPKHILTYNSPAKRKNSTHP